MVTFFNLCIKFSILAALSFVKFEKCLDFTKFYQISELRTPRTGVTMKKINQRGLSMVSSRNVHILKGVVKCTCKIVK